VTEFNKIKEDNDPDEKKYFNSDHAHLFPIYRPRSGPKCLLVLGEEKGFVKLWDISVFLSASQHDLTGDPVALSKVPSMTTKLSYNAKRKQKIDASNVAPSHLQQAKERRLPPMLDAKQCVQHYEVRGHKQALNSLREIRCSPFGFISTGMDKHVKVWSLFGECWGDIFLVRESFEKRWCFPFNWEAVREHEVDQARKVLGQIRETQLRHEIVAEESVEEEVQFDDELERMLKEQRRKQAQHPADPGAETDG